MRKMGLSSGLAPRKLNLITTPRSLYRMEIRPMSKRFLSKRFLAAALFLAASAAPAFAAKTTLVVGMPIEPPGLDPTIAAPVAIREVTWVNLYEGLVRIDRSGKVQPLLAKSWEISPDGLA